MSVIDADGHIIEPEGMFEHLPEEFHRDVRSRSAYRRTRSGATSTAAGSSREKAFPTLAAVDAPPHRCRGRSGQRRSTCRWARRL